MTELEIRRKIEQFRVSDAPHEVKQAAIKALESKLSTSADIARQQFIDSQPDLLDIQGH